MKKRIKSFSIFAFIMVFIIVFTSCGDSGSGDPTSSGSEKLTLSGNIHISTLSGGSAVTTAVIDDTLFVVYSGTEIGLKYQWKKNEITISTGGTEISYSPATIGNYTVTVGATNYVSKTSSNVVITLYPTTTPESSILSGFGLNETQFNTIRDSAGGGYQGWELQIEGDLWMVWSGRSESDFDSVKNALGPILGYPTNEEEDPPGLLGAENTKYELFFCKADNNWGEAGYMVLSVK